MNFTLNILDKNGIPLDVANLTVGSKLVSLTDVVTDSIAGLDLKAGNDYTINFPSDANAPTSLIPITFNGGSALNLATTPGSSINFTADVDITEIFLGVLSVGGESYDQTVTITGEDITITIDGNVTTGVNIATENITNDATIDITVESPGYLTYTNTVRVYNYDVNVSIILAENIIDPNDPDYRRPYPYFFYILEPCSYNIHVYDGTSSIHPLDGTYYNIDGEQYSLGQRNIVIDTCTPAVTSITQRLEIREIANCGGTSPTIWDESYTVDGITTTEYKPNVVLERPFDCCEVIDVEISINPQDIELNNTGIHECDIATVDPVLTYTITDTEGTETVLVTYSGAEVDAGDLTALGFTYTPTALGTYELKLTVTNCCTSIDQIYTFEVCNSWTITNTECNIIEISNLSRVNDLMFTIRELNDLSTFNVVEVEEVAQQNVVVAPGTVTKIDLQVDNLYTVEIVRDVPLSGTVEGEFIFVLDCNTKKCKKELLLDYLCDGGEDCDELTRNKKMESWTKFSPLAAIVYEKWDDWKQQQTIFNTLSINDIMEDVITLGKALEVMKSICNSCGITNDCSCSKRYTCNYTLTNAGYLVPTRYATIIVPNNGTDCGCS